MLSIYKNKILQLFKILEYFLLSIYGMACNHVTGVTANRTEGAPAHFHPVP